MNRPLALVAALASGILFGLGLALAQMTDPQKVKDFLDIAAIPAGGWDPSLAFVMGGGVIVTFFALRLAGRRPAPLAAPVYSLPTRTRIDLPLVGGSVIFGVGWGIAGFCPGPAFANLALVPESALYFLAAMIAGSWLTGYLSDIAARAPATSLSPDAKAA